MSEHPRRRTTCRDPTPTDSDVDTLAVAVAELRPALEAILMVSDEPLEHGAARLGRRPPGRRRRVRRWTPSPRSTPSRAAASTCAPWPVAGASTRAPEFAGVVETLRARRPAGPAHPGRAGDPVRGRLQAAGLAGPGLRDPRRQRRRRDAHAAHPRAGRGGRSGRAERRQPLPHDDLLPRAHRRHLARGAARARALPPRHGRPRGRARQRRRPRRARPEPRREPTPSPPRARPGAAPRLAPQRAGTEPDGGTEVS